MSRNVLICTVGTSLFEGNLKKLASLEANAKPKNWQAIQHAYETGQWQSLARELVQVNPNERICGAEINTIYDLIFTKKRSIQKLYLLVSDTEAGEHTGRVLKQYFLKNPLFKFSEVEYKSIEKLQDQEPRDFKIYGLRNLVRRIGEIIQRVGGPDQVMIDATGGYKAQIAIAVLIGQILNIPVSYKHERFSEIIDFPPLPVSFDYTIVGEYSGLFSFLEKTNIVTNEDLQLSELDEKVRVFLDEETVQNTTLYTLNPIGELFLLGYRLQHPKAPNLISAGDRKKPPHFRDDHYPEGFKEFVEKVWKETSWIVTTHSLPYDKQRSIKGIGFNVKEIDGNYKLVGTYRDNKDFGARFEITCTSDSSEDLIWAAGALNGSYS